MSQFYTKKGDGCCSIINGRKIDKTCIEVDALGELDELNSLIGVLKSQRALNNLKKIIHEVQENLFIIQANVAAIILAGDFNIPKFGENKVEKIEKIIRQYEKSIKPIKKFIISGSNHVSAWLDLIRAKTRKAEIAVIKVTRVKKGRKEIDPEIVPYLNRLSSLFFVLARAEAKKKRKKEEHPSYK